MNAVSNPFWRVGREFTRMLPIKRARSHAERPLASITFDDFPRSAWTVAGPILERYGVKATYYTAGRFCGLTEDGIDYFDDEDLRAVHGAGHEIGAHSFDHQMAPMLQMAELVADADRNDAFLAERIGEGCVASYAYPHGRASPRSKALMASRFATARGIAKGVNTGTIDLAELKAIPLEHRRWRPDKIDAAIKRARDCAGWAIFFTHDVSEAPSPFGGTPDMLTYVLDRLTHEGIEILPVHQAAALVVD